MGYGSGKKLIELGDWCVEERRDDGHIEGSGVRHSCGGWTHHFVPAGKCYGCDTPIPNEIIALWILHNDRV